MTFAKLVCVVLLVTVLVLVVKPARAEAMDPILISIIISGAIVVVALVAILIIANVEGGRRRSQIDLPPGTSVVAIQTVTLETAATETEGP